MARYKTRSKHVNRSRSRTRKQRGGFFDFLTNLFKPKENTGVTFVLENPALPSFINTKVPFSVDTLQFNENGEITHVLVKQTRDPQFNSLKYDKRFSKYEYLMWYHLESNQGHADFQSAALPTELWYH